MSFAEPLTINITYDPVRLTGQIVRTGSSSSSIWERLRTKAIGEQSDAMIGENTIEVSWPVVLSILRDFGTRQQQQALNFRFMPTGEAADKIKQFVTEVQQARAARNTLVLRLTREEIKTALRAKGFLKRELKEFQLRDLERLLSLPHGANFSVPGAGKTTVTFALHLLTRIAGQHLMVVGPKAAFPAWREIVSECMTSDAPDGNAEEFTILEGTASEIDRLLRSGASRFLISYDLLVRQQQLLASYLARQPVHLVLDEAHRMKAGAASQRGAFLLNVSSLSVRRDILTGTPMPQSASDLASQLAFLWPGQGLDVQIQRGVAPRSVLGQLYVRTTKQELGLPKAERHYYSEPMADGQKALYGIVRSEALRQLTKVVSRDIAAIDVMGARRSVMRLLQLSVNPVLALRAIASDVIEVKSGIVDAVLEEGPSLKMRAVADHARQLSREGRKSVIWTIFTDTIHDMEQMLADLNPVSLYGAVPTGSPNDLATREGRIRRFHVDESCKVMIANPAAAGEGISLHMVCHDAIYLDRSYVSTHYLQSIDRIHRLGLTEGTETHIHIYRTKAPLGLGSVDYSVSRRLATKLRNLQHLLDDPDLHEIAFDEENADDPVEFDVDLQDLIDLVEELEGRAPPTEDDE